MEWELWFSLPLFLLLPSLFFPFLIWLASIRFEMMDVIELSHLARFRLIDSIEPPAVKRDILRPVRLAIERSMSANWYWYWIWFCWKNECVFISCSFKSSWGSGADVSCLTAVIKRKFTFSWWVLFFSSLSFPTPSILSFFLAILLTFFNNVFFIVVTWCWNSVGSHVTGAIRSIPRPDSNWNGEINVSVDCLVVARIHPEFVCVSIHFLSSSVSADERFLPLWLELPGRRYCNVSINRNWRQRAGSHVPPINWIDSNRKEVGKM